MRRPLLDKGIKAAGFGYRSNFNNYRSCFQLSAICCQAVYRAQNYGSFSPGTHRSQDPLRHQKAINFQSCKKFDGCWGSPYLFFGDFEDLSRFHNREIPCFWRALGEANCFGPKKIKRINDIR